MSHVAVPAYFRRKALRMFGSAGDAWIADLPRILGECQERWLLSAFRPVPDLSINLVYYAESEIFGSVVLKVQGPHSERVTEMIALELYQGSGACRCYASDRDLAVMLLERIRPGYTLRTLSSPGEQLEVGIRLLRDLPRAVPRSHGLPDYRDWITRAFATIRCTYNPSGTLEKLMRSVEELFPEVADSRRYLLHGDLHHDNILFDSDHGWKAIDPQGVIGSPVLECGRFIENHAMTDEAELSVPVVRQTIERVAEGVVESPGRVAIALFVLHVLSTCWGHEMNYTRKRLSLGIRQCEGLLEIATAYRRGS